MIGSDKVKDFVFQFEYQQAQLEAEIENLSWKIERAESTDRGDLENQMDIAEKRRTTLLKDFLEVWHAVHPTSFVIRLKYVHLSLTKMYIKLVIFLFSSRLVCPYLFR